jgi:hypothetical protein
MILAVCQQLFTCIKKYEETMEKGNKFDNYGGFDDWFDLGLRSFS